MLHEKEKSSTAVKLKRKKITKLNGNENWISMSFLFLKFLDKMFTQFYYLSTEHVKYTTDGDATIQNEKRRHRIEIAFKQQRTLVIFAVHSSNSYIYVYEPRRKCFHKDDKQDNQKKCLIFKAMASVVSEDKS